MDFYNKNVLVCGIARSGVAAANLLDKHGARVTLCDKKKQEDLKEALQSIHKNITVITGENPDNIIGQQDILVLSPGIPTNLSFIKKAEQLRIPVIGEFELGSLFCKAPILAITGTNGKTTTTSMLYKILESHNPNTEAVGNIGVAFTEKAEGIPRGGYCVAEVSSFQLESILSFHPYVAAVLNITPDHLDRHGSIQSYIEIKERIFLNQDKNDFLILNYNDEVCRTMKNKAQSKVLYFSVNNKNINGIYLENDIFWLSIEGRTTRLLKTSDMKLLGNHNYENAMAAMLMAYCIGVPTHTIIKGIMQFSAVEHRIEYVTSIKGIDFYNDSKGTNPESAIKAIEAMDRQIVLIGGGYDKGSDFSLWVKSFEHKVKKIIVIGQVADIIIDTCKTYGFKDYEKEDTFEGAVLRAYEIAHEGEAVLLSPACASWGMFTDYEQRGRIFKEIVHKIENGAK